jgi:VWFA-related protein/TonB family protein
LLFAVALLLPAVKVGAQSGRNKRAQPAATPRQPAQQRQRRTAPTSSQTAPASNKQTVAAPPVNLPLNDAPPPWPTPTPVATPTSAPASTAATQEGEEVDEADVVRINSNLVTVPASVVDDKGRAVIDLKLEDFELRVDGQPKEISELGRAETPVRIVMLFDNSMSLSAAREFEKKAAVKFFRSVMRPIDQAAIYSIWTIPVFVQPFTSDVRTLVRTIENFRHPEDGATALFDTVAQAAEYLRPHQDRKVIVIVSDGADTLSNMDFLTSLKKVMTADIQVYAVQTGQLESTNLYNLAAHHRLQEYTSQTGGAVYVPRVATDLDAAFAQISADLSQQYVLSYYPQDGRNDGRFRTISLRVKTRPNTRVRARKGYYDRTGQKHAFVPVESMNATVNQPQSARPEQTSSALQNVPSPSVERRELTPAMNSTSTVGRRKGGGSTVGPPGPDDEPERAPRVETTRSTGFSETPSPSPDTAESSSTPSATPTPTPTPTPSSTPTSAANPTPTRPPTNTSQPAPKKPLTGGVLNGKALVLPKPVYPPAAKRNGASGTIVVEVLIDESGKVISARAVSGPPALQAAAVQAARQAKFSPTTLSGQPVQVVGTITYTFTRP